MGQANPICMDMSEDAQKRHRMLEQNYDRLRYFAKRAKEVYGLRNDQVVLLCIKVDTEWRDIVDIMMPDQDWQPIRDQGLEPIARGVEKVFICELIAEKLPDIADVIMEDPDEGLFKCIVLDETGGTVYNIVPA